MDTDWESHWGNFLVTHRTLENWRKYGEEAGHLLAENEWDEFVFYRDASSLALTPSAVDKKVEWAIAEFTALRLFGSKMHAEYGGKAGATPAELKIWVKAFRQAYTETIEAHVDELIPEKLKKNLDLFCNLLSWMRVDLDHGGGHAAQYGLTIAGRKKEVEPQKEPPKPTYKPTKKEMLDYISENAQQKVDSAWKGYMARKSDGAGFRTSMMHFSFAFPRNWDTDEVDFTTGAYLFEKAFVKALGDRALELAPVSAWKNAYLICTLYDQMLAQAPGRKKSGEGAHHRGFWAKENRKNSDEGVQRRKLEQEIREKVQKDLEKEAKQKEKQAAHQKPKMGGNVVTAVPPQALVIVHLSSLDSYTDYAGSEEGKLLGERLTRAILGHDGPVIIVDQGWETGYRPSRPRETLLEEIQPRRDIIWIQFDEAGESWDDFFPKLYAALDQVGARSAVVGGVWYEPSLHTGCATFVYLNLRQRMPTVVDEDLVGCE